MGFKLFNPIGLGILGKLTQAGESTPEIWDGTYIGGYCQVSGPQFTFNTGVRSIYIDVSNIDAGEQIKVTCSAVPDRFRFAASVDLIEDLPTSGSYLLLSGSFYQAPADSTEPYEYIYTIPVSAKTAIFYISSSTQETVTSVEVI